MTKPSPNQNRAYDRASVRNYPKAPFPKDSQFKNLTGEIYGRLRVIRYLGVMEGRSRWLCLCDFELNGCGSYRLKTSSNLRGGSEDKTCGCRSRKKKRRPTDGAVPESRKKKRRPTDGAVPEIVDDPDQISNLIRSELIRRLDNLLAKRIMPVAMGERFGLDPDQWSDLVRLIQESLFPEDFADRPPVSYRDAGIIPGKGRLERVALSDYEKFAKVFAN